ncbi:MAG: hypothetical protein NZO16_05015, partial [Deltaproteobacteria bacterium]|nr:hypothetical protein [Deltaproteobacteria bacterium]
MSKGRKTLVFILLIIIIAQVVFLVVTLESTKSVQEEFDIQTKGLPAAKKILLAKNFYLSKYKKKPSSLADLGEFVDISKLLNEVSEK